MSNLARVEPQQHSSLFWYLSDSLVLIRRSLTHIVKSMDQLLSVLFQPIMFMLLFRYVFGGAIDTGGTTYVNFLVAGILVQSAAFGAMTTSVGVATDLQRGIIDRFKSLPMFSSTVLTGHVVADLVRNFISSVVMITVGLLVGFRPEANFVEWLMVFGLLMLFSFTFSWIAVIIGLVAKSVEAVQWFGFILIFPLTFASSAFVPTEGMPTVLRVFAENQPVTQVIDAIRALLNGMPMGDHGWKATLWCLVGLAIAMPVSAYMFRHRDPV